MSELYKQEGFPHKDWECIGVTDLKPADAVGDDYDHGTCEVCGRDDLRYVHTLRHNDYPKNLDTGCECASKLENNSKSAGSRERGLTNLANRRARWLSRTWQVSAKGGYYLTHKGYKLGVSKRGNGWGYWLIDTRDGIIFGKSKTYATINEAKLALFSEASDFFKWSRST